MRARLVSAVLLTLSLSLTSAACSGGPDMPVKVTGKYGVRPDLTFPKGKPTGDLAITTPTKGKGAPVRKGDLVIANYVGYRWNEAGGKLLESSYAAGQPAAFPSGRLVKGLDQALIGKKVGSRVVAVIPPEYGYTSAATRPRQLTGSDSLVYVLDIVATYAKTARAQGERRPLNEPGLPQVGDAQPGQAPPVAIPSGKAPSKPQARLLVAGAGPAVKSGQLTALQFTGVRWRDGKTFYSTWSQGTPAAEVLGVGQDIKAFDQALVGQKVGSRVLLVVPPKWGYGSKGLPRYGIKGTDTLVYVVDILGAH